MTVQPKVFRYEADVEWRGGRVGVSTAGGRRPLAVTPPGTFPGGDESAWSPEHLYLASLQSCMLLSFLAHCAHNGVEVVAYRAHTTGELARREEDRRYAFTSVAMVVLCTVSGGHAAAARGLTAKAERDCFVSASTTAPVAVDWRIVE
ncbi:MAG TPA: OsmC family protein [Gaiellales bacterium]|nr:OsmC family protein [Gaiellales bacterium]